MKDLARRHWLLAASVAVLAAALLLFPSAWHAEWEGHTRGGQSFRISYALRGLCLAGGGVLMYLVAAILPAPSAGESAVARWLARALGVATIWGAIYLTIP
jgi:hypothetical protein